MQNLKSSYAVVICMLCLFIFTGILLSGETNAATAKSILFVGITGKQLPALWKVPLAQAGFPGQNYVEWENLTPSLLKQNQVVVLVSPSRRSSISQQDKAIADMLVDYVNVGGGLMITQAFDQMQASMTIPMYLMERLESRILLEKVVVPQRAIKKVGIWDSDIFAFSSLIGQPWTNGIKGIWYPAIDNMGCLTGVLPFLPTASWQVTLTAMPEVKTEIYLCGLDSIDRSAREKGFATAVPLAGCRSLGEGRVAYIGCYAPIIFNRNIKTDDDAKTYASYMQDGIDGKPSDLLRFYANAFIWLGANSGATANADLKLAFVPQTSHTTFWKIHKGIIGPRTKYSTGCSSPDEYVVKAKDAGLDFVVFLEDFAELKPGAFEQLKEDCRRLTTNGFVALPGITFQNNHGNHEFVFSDSLSLLSQNYLTDDGKRIKAMSEDGTIDLRWWYSILSFENASGWYNFKDNPYPFYDSRTVCMIGIVLQEDGKTLERIPEAHGYQARSGQGTWPVAINLMRSASEIDQIKDGTSYVNAVGAEGSKHLFALLSTGLSRSAHLFPGSTSFGNTYLSNGPDISLTMPRGDTDPDGNPYNPNLQNWPLKLKITSNNGLREIMLNDGNTTIRRFLPGGAKEFNFSTSIPNERQHGIWVQAIDMKGKEAIGRDISCNSWLLRENQCLDRMNQLLDSRQKRSDGTPFFVGYGGDTTMPDKGPWNGRIRPVGCFVFDQKLGTSASYDGSPENNPTAVMNPYLVVDGAMPPVMGWSRAIVAGREGAPHVRPERVVASSDVLIGDRVLDGVFPVDAKPVIHVWHSLYPVKPSQYLKTTARTYFFRVKPDGISAYLYCQDFTILQDIPLKETAPFVVGVGAINARSAKKILIVNDNQAVEQGPIQAHPLKTYSFNTGDYICFLNSPFGSLAAYSLTDGLVLEGDGVNFNIGVKGKGNLLNAQSSLQAKVLLIGMNRMVADPAAMAAKIRTDYGLVGKPEYEVNAIKGKVLSQQYILEAVADQDGVFQSRINHLAAMDGNLGCMVRGLHDNWSAVFQQINGNSVKTRLIPVEKGIGYALLQAEDEGRQLAIGHPFTVNVPEIVLTLTRIFNKKNWRLEIHNPTEKELNIIVCSNPAFTGLKFKENLKIAPGSSTIRTIEGI